MQGMWGEGGGGGDCPITRQVIVAKTSLDGVKTTSANLSGKVR